jgi:maleylacetate reductase
MALHHKLCHTLGGSFDLPHAETHAGVLPHATAYNASDAPEAMRVVAEALGTGDAPRGLYDLASRLGANGAEGSWTAGRRHRSCARDEFSN